MRNAIARIVLLRSYPSPPSGAGRTLFALGKSIGIIGRVVAAVFLVVVAVAAAIDQRSLLLAFLTSYAVLAFAVASEVLSSVLMHLGNRLAAKAAGPQEGEA